LWGAVAGEDWSRSFSIWRACASVHLRMGDPPPISAYCFSIRGDLLPTPSSDDAVVRVSCRVVSLVVRVSCRARVVSCRVRRAFVWRSRDRRRSPETFEGRASARFPYKTHTHRRTRHTHRTHRTHRTRTRGRHARVSRHSERGRSREVVEVEGVLVRKEALEEGSDVAESLGAAQVHHHHRRRPGTTTVAPTPRVEQIHLKNGKSKSNN
jgi:hypothetical protein